MQEAFENSIFCSITFASSICHVCSKMEKVHFKKDSFLEYTMTFIS